MSRKSEASSRHLSGLGSHVTCVILAGLSSLAFGIVEMDQSSSPWLVRAWIGCEWLALGLAAWYLRRVGLRLDGQPAVSPVILAIFVGSCLFDPLSRAVWGVGRPFEILIGFSLKNSVLALAAAGAWRSYQRLAVCGSLFLQMFALTLLPTRVWPVTVVFAIVALWWLMGSHWEQIALRLESRHKHQVSVPRGMIVVVLGLLLVLGATELFADRAVTRQLSGWLPSSGGDGQYDPHARDGVGDGDALVAGSENIQSFAPIEEAPFKSSDEPSLYDVYSDVYDEPVRPKSQGRAIALPPEQMEDLCCRMAKSELAGKQFSTQRQASKKSSSKMKDLKSEALFYVAGRTPLHLRHELYDLYDGVTWYPEDGEKLQPRLRVEQIGKRSWISLAPSGMAYNNYDMYGPKETHALKIAHLNTNRIPSPNQLLGIHIDQMDDVTMLQEVQSGLLALDAEHLPAMLPIHLSSRVLDNDRVDEEVRSYPLRPKSQALPDDPRFADIARLAQSWGKTPARSQQQIRAVIDRLKTECKLDMQRPQEHSQGCTVYEFLFDTKVGPDYQFATAAAILLKSLGYQTRLVSGYYVRPEKFERKSGHTPVHKEDVHFWVELSLGAGQWMTIDPTPGYEVLGPPPTIFQQAWRIAVVSGGWLWTHRLAVTLTNVVLFVVVIFRAWWIDALRLMLWRQSMATSYDKKIIAAQRLLESRFARHGLSRRAHEPVTTWLGRVARSSAQDHLLLREFAELVAGVHYRRHSTSNGHLTQQQLQDVEVCRRVLRTYSLRSIPRLFPKPTANLPANNILSRLTALAGARVFSTHS